MYFNMNNLFGIAMVTVSKSKFKNSNKYYYLEMMIEMIERREFGRYV